LRQRSNARLKLFRKSLNGKELRNEKLFAILFEIGYWSGYKRADEVSRRSEGKVFDLGL